MANKLSDGTIRDEENDDLRAGCKLGRGDAVWSVGVDGGNNCLGGLVGVQIDVRLSHVLCGVKLIGVAVGCDGFSTKFCTSRINLSFCFLSCSIASSCVIYLLLRLVTCCLISVIVDIRLLPGITDVVVKSVVLVAACLCVMCLLQETLSQHLSTLVVCDRLIFECIEYII